MENAPLDVPPGPLIEKHVADWSALLSTIERQEDLEDLESFLRRWWRLPRAATAGLVVVATTLLSCWLFTPSALGEAAVGSLVLLLFVVYDFGAVAVYGNLVGAALLSRETRYDHRLFWPSPADSSEVERAMHATSFMGFATGMWINAYLGLGLVAVGWDSQLVLPLVATFVVTGYASTFVYALGSRRSIHSIIERSKRSKLRVVHDRIEGFRSRFADLTSDETDRLRDLLFVHDRIQDAQSTSSTPRTVLRAAVNLIIPTITALLAIFADVYAERIFDAILP